jgi:hypothetical protein
MFVLRWTFFDFLNRGLKPLLPWPVRSSLKQR